MRVLIITGTYCPSTNGITSVIEQEKDLLEKAGHTAIILAPKHPGQKAKEPGVYRFPSLPNPFSPDDPVPLMPLDRTVSHLITHHGINLIHSHFPFHLGRLASKLAKKHHLPLVMTVHTNWEEYVKRPDQYMKFLPRAWRRYFYKTGAYAPYSHATRVICLSQFMAKELKKRFPRLPISVLPTGVAPLPLSPKSKAQLRKALGLPPTRPVLLYLGRLSAEKNLKDLLTTLTLLPPDYLLLLVGDGHEREKLAEMAHHLGLADRIIFTGMVPHQHIALYLQSADLFVSTSVTENQPITYLEAAYGGLPLAVYKSNAAKEWVPKTIGVQSDPNPKALAAAIMKLGPAELEHLSKEARLFGQLYSSSRITKKLLDLFEQLLDDQTKIPRVTSKFDFLKLEF